MEVTLLIEDGDLIMSASLKRPDGTSRFSLAFPKKLIDDLGARHLVLSNAKPGGYEPPTQWLIENTLRPGDLFIDIGAHWGFYSLQAATHPAGGIRVVAIEPDPTNASILFRNVMRNSVEKAVFVVSSACGDVPGIAPLISNTTMGHNIGGIYGAGPVKWVPVMTLDAVLAKLSLAEPRLIIKIDAEGFEPRIVAGARTVLASGRCKLLIWEHGHAIQDEVANMVAALSSWGFKHLRPNSADSQGPLVPFVFGESYKGNVFSVRSLTVEEN
jgi:FkbM family methyltransferase